MAATRGLTKHFCATLNPIYREMYCSNDYNSLSIWKAEHKTIPLNDQDQHCHDCHILNSQNSLSSTPDGFGGALGPATFTISCVIIAAILFLVVFCIILMLCELFGTRRRERRLRENENIQGQEGHRNRDATGYPIARYPTRFKYLIGPIPEIFKFY